MEILVALLPLLLWTVLFVVLIRKFKFDRNIFIICLGITVFLNFRLLISSYFFSGLINVVGQTLFLYVVVDFIYHIVKRKKLTKENHL